MANFNFLKPVFKGTYNWLSKPGSRAIAKARLEVNTAIHNTSDLKRILENKNIPKDVRNAINTKYTEVVKAARKLHSSMPKLFLSQQTLDNLIKTKLQNNPTTLWSGELGKAIALQRYNQRIATTFGLGTLGLAIGSKFYNSDSEPTHEGYYYDPEVGWTFNDELVQAGHMGYDRNGDYNYFDGNNWIHEGDYKLLSNGTIMDKRSGSIIGGEQSNGNYFLNNMRQLGISSFDEAKNLQRMINDTYRQKGINKQINEDGLIGRLSLSSLQELGFLE